MYRSVQDKVACILKLPLKNIALVMYYVIPEVHTLHIHPPKHSYNRLLQYLVLWK